MRRYDNPPAYNPTSSSEETPLIPNEPSHLHQSFKSLIRLIRRFQTALIVIITASIAIGIIYASVFNACNDPLDPDVRNRIRKEWEFELLKRAETERRWQLEDSERIRLREQWGREAEEHKREMEERRKHEEEGCLRLNTVWTDLESHTCTSYGTREYTARLANIPSYYNRRVDACMAAPVQIHGVEYTPKWCEDHGPNNVIGHWEVDQHEPDCASYWIWYKDFGCISPGSGQRRIEHHLENIPSGGDWKEFCATTPVSFRGMHFTGAQFCFNKNNATWGHWAIDDESCD
ncbi:hypothetical protein EDB19DRAFT_125373 [Suillus lakei]|nr:hypothetical protein EDB19DRAFT_125373 [Suillus lakei]